ncbi:MAG TPA: hypothetical protein VHW71_17090 [Steroidobacteraceae bacterium]|nr:hypothetical protein [Steroidobacteraceae bacterium]
MSWNIAIKRSIIKALPKGLRNIAEPVERALSQVRASGPSFNPLEE